MLVQYVLTALISLAKGVASELSNTSQFPSTSITAIALTTKTLIIALVLTLSCGDCILYQRGEVTLLKTCDHLKDR